MLHARRTQEPIDLRRADSQQFLLKSFGQRDLQQLATELVTGRPDPLEHRQHLGGNVTDFRAAAFVRSRGQGSVQEPQRGCAMRTAGGAKLVENFGLVRPTGALRATVEAGRGLAFDGQAQVRGFGNHQYESTYQQTPRPLPCPSNIHFESTRQDVEFVYLWMGLSPSAGLLGWVSCRISNLLTVSRKLASQPRPV